MATKRFVNKENPEAGNKLFLAKLGLRIRTVRLRKKMQQRTLAEKCEMDTAALCRIETGKTNPTIITLHCICQALGIRLVDLFKIGS